MSGEAATFGPFVFSLNAEEYDRLRERLNSEAQARFMPGRSWLPNIVAVAVIFAIAIWLFVIGALEREAAVWVMMVGVAGLFAGQWLHYWETRKAHSGFHSTYKLAMMKTWADVSVSARAAGLTVATPLYVTTIAWPYVRRVDEAHEIVWLWISGVQPVLVPYRAFASVEMRQAFVVSVKAHVAPAPVSP